MRVERLYGAFIAALLIESLLLPPLVGYAQDADEKVFGEEQNFAIDGLDGSKNSELLKILAEASRKQQKRDFEGCLEALESIPFDSRTTELVLNRWKSLVKSLFDEIVIVEMEQNPYGRFEEKSTLKRTHKRAVAGLRAIEEQLLTEREVQFNRVGELAANGYFIEARELLRRLVTHDQEPQVVRLRREIERLEQINQEATIAPNDDVPEKQGASSISDVGTAPFIAKLMPSMTELKKFKVNRKHLDKFNSCIDILNHQEKTYKSWTEVKLTLTILNQAGMNLAVDYPPALERIRGIMARYGTKLRTDPIVYFGTQGRMDLKVGSPRKGDTLAPPGYCRIMCILKVYLDDYTPANAQISAITSDGRRFKALSEYDLPIDAIGGWDSDFIGTGYLEIPTEFNKDQERVFYLFFPAEITDRVKTIEYTEGSFRLTVPIW